MARNAEKAMTTLARWRAAQVSENGIEKERRPYIAAECEDLGQAEKWRMQIVREVSKKVSQIQNAGLGEFRIRDLNDEINKLLREKKHWEKQIVNLGGPDYRRIGPRMLDREGKEVPGNRGYKYFGAAKELPGVRDLFEQEPPAAPRKNRAELMKDIDADYYGYRDDDDGILEPLEQQSEKEAIAKEVALWKARQTDPDTGKNDEDDKDSDNEAPEKDETPITNEGPKFLAHVPVPTQLEVEAALLKRKKQQLLDQFKETTENNEEQSREQPTIEL